MSNDTLTYQELEHNCPLSCPFLRKIPEKHFFLCCEYRVFLETDKYGLPRRSGKCGIKDIDNAKAVLKSLSEHLDKSTIELTREDKELLKNVMLVLDSSEREALDMLLNTQSIAKAFTESFNKQPKDSSLLANTRALIKEYEEKYLKSNKEKNRSKSQEENQMKKRNDKNNSVQCLKKRGKRIIVTCKKK